MATTRQLTDLIYKKMLAPEEPTGKPDTKGFIEVLERTVVGYLGLSYIIGFIVVNIYLYKCGSCGSFELLRLNYLLSGFWALLPSVICTSFFTIGAIILVFISSTLKEFRKSKEESESLKNSLPIILIGISLVLFLYVSLFIIITDLLLKNYFTSYPYTILLSSFLSALIAISFICSKRRKDKTNSGFTNHVYTSTSIIISFLSILILICYLFDFSYGMYGEIPCRFGGGKPQMVQIVVKSGNSELMPLFGKYIIPLKQGAFRTSGVKLLYTTDHEYILDLDELIRPDVWHDPPELRPRVISLRRDLVSAVVYVY